MNISKVSRFRKWLSIFYQQNVCKYISFKHEIHFVAQDYVALTLLGIPKSSASPNSSNEVNSSQVLQPPSSNEYITAPKGQMVSYCVFNCYPKALDS